MDEVLESTGKCLKSPSIINPQYVKCETVYYKWRVLQICYKQVYVIILSAAFYSVLYLWADHFSVSHCSLNFDTPSVGYSFSLIISVLENHQCRSLKILEFDTLRVLLMLSVWLGVLNCVLCCAVQGKGRPWRTGSNAAGTHCQWAQVQSGYQRTPGQSELVCWFTRPLAVNVVFGCFIRSQ